MNNKIIAGIAGIAVIAGAAGIGLAQRGEGSDWQAEIAAEVAADPQGAQEACEGMGMFGITSDEEAVEMMVGLLGDTYDTPIRESAGWTEDTSGVEVPASVTVGEAMEVAVSAMSCDYLAAADAWEADLDW